MLTQVKHNEVMQVGDKLWLPVSIAETRISKRYDTIPSGTLYPNADEIAYLQRLVRFKVSGRTFVSLTEIGSFFFFF